MGEADTPSVHTSIKGISVSKTEYALSNPHVATNCPEVSFLVEYSVQPMQAEPITCHGMDTPKPGGQAYHIKAVPLKPLTTALALLASLAVCPRRLVARTVVAMLRWSVLHGLLGL